MMLSLPPCGQSGCPEFLCESAPCTCLSASPLPCGLPLPGMLAGKHMASAYPASDLLATWRTTWPGISLELGNQANGLMGTGDHGGDSVS